MVMQNITNVLDDDIEDFKTMFNGVTKLGLPFMWDGNVEFYSKKECMSKLRDKRNEEPEEEMEGFINENQSFEILKHPFHI